MLVKMPAKLQEDVNRLADQFSHLRLCDEIRNPPCIVVSNNIFTLGIKEILISKNAGFESGDSNRKVTSFKNGSSNQIDSSIPIGSNIQKVSSIKNGESNQSGVRTNKKCYALSLPEGAKRPADDSALIFSELKLALAAIKSSYKGARFKEFTSEKDALNFSSKPQQQVVERETIREDDSTLKSATSQELCQLRKCIERGDEISVAKTIWGNPKILVGKSDTPSVMHEGIRYNALHVAAKSNKPFICQLILDTIENPKFLKQIYPSETESAREKRRHYLLDLYINTPDKKTGDTPLHYASKFGCIECIKILLCHPFCDSETKNISGLAAKEIICSRAKPESNTLIEDIEEVFKGMVYIPILRSDLNDVPPVVGKPCSCKDIAEHTCGDVQTSQKPVLSLKAFVGPMSPEIAEQFYLVLKNPSSPYISSYSPDELKVISKIRFTDKEKGIERIGRWLAEDLKVEWREYFPLLDVFTNLNLEEGLETLEKHLNTLSRCISPLPPREPEEQSIYLIHQYPSHVNPLSHYVNMFLEREKEIDDDCDETYSTPPSSPVKCGDAYDFVTPPASPSHAPYTLKEETVFLQGSRLSKLDIDMLLAVGDFEIDVHKYPNISKWKWLVRTELQSVNVGSSPRMTSLASITSVVVPKFQLSDRICTPRKTLLNNAFCCQ